MATVPAAVSERLSAPGDHGSFSFEEFGPAQAIAETAAGWGGDLGLNLLFYDPSATAAPSTTEIFTRPHRLPEATRAGLLARATAILHGHGRELAARAFAKAMEKARWPRFFLSCLQLAPSLDCPG